LEVDIDYKMYIPSQEEVQQHYPDHDHDHNHDHNHGHDVEEQEEGLMQQVVGQEQLVSGCTVVHYI